MGLVEWWRTQTRIWVIPAKDADDDSCVPLYQGPVTKENRRGFERLWKQLSDLERHEDTLFNSRTQSFLVVTSFLLAGMSQFREPPYFYVQLLFCFFGIALAGCAGLILSRTARSIEWYLEALCRLDKILYPNDMQPYGTRRVKTGRRSAGPQGKYLKTPVSALLGILLPAAAALMWSAMLVWSLAHHYPQPPIASTQSESLGEAKGEPSQITVIQQRTDSECSHSQTNKVTKAKQTPLTKKQTTKPCQPDATNQ
jgi:hypothetical protein